jgi:hypothetical protein
MQLFEDSNSNNPWFGPSLEEPGISSDEPFLSKEPLEILQEGSFNKVPYILGANSHDGNYIVDASEFRFNKGICPVVP